MPGALRRLQREGARKAGMVRNGRLAVATMQCGMSTAILGSNFIFTKHDALICAVDLSMADASFRHARTSQLPP